MIQKIQKLLFKYRKAIGRPRSKSKLGITERQKWLQPLMMPKLHCLAHHCTQFVWHHGHLGAFSEESFEHFQQVSGLRRRTKTHNKSEGAQISDDLQYSWIAGSPKLQKACQDAEERRMKLGAPIRKRRFSTTFQETTAQGDSSSDESSE